MIDPQFSLIYEILRSYVALARSLSLSKTVAELGITRQTIRRHVRALEEIKGVALLAMEGQHYSLTENGEKCLDESALLLDSFAAWMSGDASSAFGRNSLQKTTYQDRQGLEYCAQRHPLFRLWTDSPPLMQSGFKAWAQSQGQEARLNQLPFWENVMVYRQLGDNWLIVSIGEKSVYRTWLDLVWVNSAVGRPITDAPISLQMTNFLSVTFSEAQALGAPRLDHVYTQTHWKQQAEPKAAAFQRLLFPLIYPDQSMALASLVVLTNQIEIDGLPVEKLTNLNTPPSHTD